MGESEGLTDRQFQEVIDDIYSRTGDEDLLALSQAVHLGGATWDEVVDYLVEWQFSSAAKVLARSIQAEELTAEAALKRMAVHVYEIATRQVFEHAELRKEIERDE